MDRLEEIFILGDRSGESVWLRRVADVKTRSLRYHSSSFRVLFWDIRHIVAIYMCHFEVADVAAVEVVVA